MAPKLATCMTPIISMLLSCPGAKTDQVYNTIQPFVRQMETKYCLSTPALLSGKLIS